MKFVDLVRDAHGCVLPDAATHCLGPVGDDVAYDVYLWDWEIRLLVLVPALAVVGLQMAANQPVDPRVYKVRPQDAIAHALAAFDVQPREVRTYLQGRFGPMLPKARELAARWWVRMDVR